MKKTLLIFILCVIALSLLLRTSAQENIEEEKINKEFEAQISKAKAAIEKRTEFDVKVVNDDFGIILEINSTTGKFRFESDGVVLSGKGEVAQKGCVLAFTSTHILMADYDYCSRTLRGCVFTGETKQIINLTDFDMPVEEEQ